MPVPSIEFYDSTTVPISRALSVVTVLMNGSVIPLETLTEMERTLHHRSVRPVHLQVFGVSPGWGERRCVVVGMSEIAEIPGGPDCLIPVAGPDVGEMEATDGQYDMVGITDWNHLLSVAEECFNRVNPARNLGSEVEEGVPMSVETICGLRSPSFPLEDGGSRWS